MILRRFEDQGIVLISRARTSPHVWIEPLLAVDGITLMFT
jgi:hypothetical protein